MLGMSGVKAVIYNLMLNMDMHLLIHYQKQYIIYLILSKVISLILQNKK